MKKAGEILLLALSLLLLGNVSVAAQERATPYIYALYNPVVIPTGQTSGSVTLIWDGGKDHPYAEVWVRIDQNDETFIVENGKGTRAVKVELGKRYVFKLSDSNVLLASVSVTVERGDVSAQPKPVPIPTPDYQPLYAVNGKIRWKKAYGVVPVNSNLQNSIDNRCISFYVAALDPRTNQPLRGDHSQMWKADDEGDYYVCRYALKLPMNTQVRVVAQMGGDGLLPKPDPNPLFLTRAWVGGDSSQSRPPQGAMRAFTGSKYVTLDRQAPRASVDFELYYALPRSDGPR